MQVYEGKARKVFFFEKKKQKTFIYFWVKQLLEKSFLVLFFKKERACFADHP